MNAPDTLQRRRKSIAALLSLVGTGAGHLYAGRPRRGLILFACTLVFVPVCFLVSRMEPSPIAFWLMMGSVAFVVLTFFVAIVDAMWCAARAPDPYARQPCNHPLLYVLLAVVAVGWGFGGMHLVRAGAFEAFVVPTRSMEPAIASGDRVLVNKRRVLDVPRGAIVVFRSPENPDKIWIKRVVGVASDRFSMKDNTILRNGEVLRKERMVGTGQEPLVVPKGHVYLLGDGPASRDSRTFGTLPAGMILGTAEYVFSGDGVRVLR